MDMYVNDDALHDKASKRIVSIKRVSLSVCLTAPASAPMEAYPPNGEKCPTKTPAPLKMNPPSMPLYSMPMNCSSVGALFFK